MTTVKKSGVIFTIILIVLSGCSKNSEPDAAKIVNANQPPPASSGNSNVSINNGNASVVPANTPPLPPVNKDKKSSSPVKEPTPVVGSGGGDMFLFTQTRGALSSDSELLNNVIVEIKEGIATLSGSVSSEAQKKKAEQIVKGVQGIKGVKNNLKVS